MGDPLMSIDAESVEKNVNDSFKTMHKSVKIFNEIPGKRCGSCRLLQLYEMITEIRYTSHRA